MFGDPSIYPGSKFVFADRKLYEKLLKFGKLQVQVCMSGPESGLKGLVHTIYHYGDVLCYFYGTQEELLTVLKKIPGILNAYRQGYNFNTRLYVKHLDDTELPTTDRVEDHKLWCNRFQKEEDPFIVKMSGPYIYHPRANCSCGADRFERWGDKFYTNHPNHNTVIVEAFVPNQELSWWEWLKENGRLLRDGYTFKRDRKR